MSQSTRRRSKRDRGIAKRKRKDPPREASKLDQYLGKYGVYAVVFLISAVAIFVFRDFLLLKKVYLFRDIGSDSINAVYPQMAHLVDYLKREGFPGWSFNRGMGQNIFPFSVGDPFVIAFYLFGKNRLPFAFAYVEVAKILLGGFFFFLYLRIVLSSYYAAVVGALLFGFTGYMIVGGGWYIFSYDALCGALLLYSFEKFFKQKVWALLPVPVALLGAFQPFDLYLYGLLLAAYATIRYLNVRGWNPREYSSFALKLGALFVLGVALSSVFLFSNVLQLLQSPRVGGEAAYFQKLSNREMFQTAPAIQTESVFMRTFSSDLIGTGNDFTGWMNYLESPLTYCGLLPLLLAPQAFSFTLKRRKSLYVLVGTACIVPLIFPFFRYLFWLFSGDYFRTFTFFISLVLLCFGAKSLAHLETSSRLNLKLLVISLIVLLIILYYPYDDKVRVNLALRTIITVFLSAYFGLLLMMRSQPYKRYAQIGLLLAVCVELAYFSGISVNKRSYLTTSDLTARTGYNDYTNEAVSYIQSIDGDFFRVNKDYSSGLAMHSSINDGQIQNYYGLSCYSSFNQKYYIRFQEKLDIIQTGNELQTRWAHGPLDRPLLQTLVSVKYSLTKRPDANAFGPEYEHLADFNDIHVYRNRNYLPLGFSYDSYLTVTDLLNLSSAQKDQALLKAFVIEDEDRDRFREFRQFDVRTLDGQYAPGAYESDIAARRKNVLAMNLHTQNRIAGTVSLDAKQLMFFSIPYDKGWTATIDGNKAELFLIDTGFLGLIVDKGTHRISLDFRRPLLVPGLGMSLAALLVYGYLLFRFRPLHKKESAAAESNN